MVKVISEGSRTISRQDLKQWNSYAGYIYIHIKQQSMLSRYNDIAANQNLVLYHVLEDPAEHQFSLIKKPFGETEAKDVVEKNVL